jgi:FkbM family methyltransferase
MKTLIKKLLFFFLKKENKNIAIILRKVLKSKFHFLDVGAAEGISNRWKIIEDSISVSLVEPHKESAQKLKSQGNNVIEKLLYEKKNLKLTLFETKKPLCSSVLKPNFTHINKYPKPDRFKIINQTALETSTIDDEFALTETPSFVKIDTEGVGVEILRGSAKSLKNILGIEIECEFFKLREEQHLFEETRKFLESHNFEFIDFLNIIRWERENHRFTGQPQVSDVLFLQSPELIINNFKNDQITEEIFLKYIVILTIYNRSDILSYVINNLEVTFVNKYELKKLHNLVEKKVKRINFVEKFTWFLKAGINNLI